MYQFRNFLQLFLIRLSQASGEVGDGGKELLIAVMFNRISKSKLMRIHCHYTMDIYSRKVESFFHPFSTAT
jgi:hypothetical protein